MGRARVVPNVPGGRSLPEHPGSDHRRSTAGDPYRALRHRRSCAVVLGGARLTRATPDAGASPRHVANALAIAIAHASASARAHAIANGRKAPPTSCRWGLSRAFLPSCARLRWAAGQSSAMLGACRQPCSPARSAARRSRRTPRPTPAAGRAATSSTCHAAIPRHPATRHPRPALTALGSCSNAGTRRSPGM